MANYLRLNSGFALSDINLCNLIYSKWGKKGAFNFLILLDEYLFYLKLENQQNEIIYISFKLKSLIKSLGINKKNIAEFLIFLHKNKIIEINGTDEEKGLVFIKIPSAFDYISKFKPYRTFKDSFYTTQEWRELRFQFLKTQIKKCILCGSRNSLHVDHIKPRSKYPELELDINNLQILCRDCNLGKSNKDETNFKD